MPPLIDGAELLLVQFAFDPRYEPVAEFGRWEADLGLRMEVDERDIELPSRQLDGTYLAITVPVGSEVVLWIEDDDREQGLDLREAAAVDRVPGYADGIGVSSEITDGWEYKDAFHRNGGDYLYLSCWHEWAEVARTVWLEDHGWAPDGTAFLTVEFWFCDGEDPGRDIEWSMDVASSVKVWDGSDYIELIEWTEEPYNGKAHCSYKIAVFEVPIDVETFIVDFVPVVEGREDGSGDVYKLRSLAEATEWEVSF